MSNYAEIFTGYSQEFKQLYSSTDTVIKDKVLTVRVEEGFYNILEALAESMQTETVAGTARAILSMFITAQVYKFELENMKPEKIAELFQQGTGSFYKFKKFLEELENFSEFLTEAEEKSKVALEFIEQEKRKVQETLSKLRQVQTSWTQPPEEKEKK